MFPQVYNTRVDDGINLYLNVFAIITNASSLNTNMRMDIYFVRKSPIFERVCSLYFVRRIVIINL